MLSKASRPRAGNTEPIARKMVVVARNSDLSIPKITNRQDRILASFLKCALAMPDEMPSGRLKAGRDWSWSELVDELQLSGAWLVHVRHLAEDMDLV
jgi:hypothetical protein